MSAAGAVSEYCRQVANCTSELLYEQQGEDDANAGYADDATWVLTSSFVILTMQSGFGLLEMG